MLVYLDDICIGKSLCNIKRRDVIDAGYALRSGFFFEIPKSAYKQHSQKLTVKDKDGQLLPLVSGEVSIPALPILNQCFTDNLTTPVVFSSSSLYTQGGFYDGYYDYHPAKVIDRIEDMGIAFSRTTSQRTYPVLHVDEINASLGGIFLNTVQHVLTALSVGSPAHIVRIKEAWIYCNVVIVSNEQGFYPLYETWRNIDRPHIPEGLMRQFVLELEKRNFSVFQNGGFVSSSGYENYGHWLVDDLPRAVALIDRGCNKILATSASKAINKARTQTIAALRVTEVSLEYLAYGTLVYVENLTYCTPVSYHPALKSRDALLAMKSKYRLTDGGNRKLFVNRRKSSGRNIVNYSDFLTAIVGYEEIFCEDMTFIEQINAFSQASVIIGLMGASMTNIIFCRSQCSVLFLAPGGWEEVFYWDLCDTLSLRYNIHFCRKASEDVSHRSDMIVDVAKIREFIRAA